MNSSGRQSTALVPYEKHEVATLPGGGGRQEPPHHTGTGTGYDGYMPVRKPREIDGILDTKGPLRWVDRRNGSWNAYDGHGRSVYYATENGGRIELHYYPAGSVWNDTHSYIGSYRRITDVKDVAGEDHRGRSGGKGY